MDLERGERASGVVERARFTGGSPPKSAPSSKIASSSSEHISLIDASSSSS
eukprot:CAMPEP_0174746930 /NCGR_PEP_ID=MMETSP1094-20130205/90152_1 /TAXON_ID=156173 /ORGANISM="Chrysochromulina brevifilum, Strain UTEX LB 985" /LENGTH=50 /DNA_ID=CAMNT_0015951727 /DNA_START=119 /DNA_END=268 /DNA_ORIENTATION=+